MSPIRIGFLSLVFCAGLGASVHAQDPPTPTVGDSEPAAANQGAPAAEDSEPAGANGRAPTAPAPSGAAVPAQPARGPADLIRRANAPRPSEDMDRRAGPAPQAARTPHNEMFGAPRMAPASPDPALPVGTIEVRIRDVQGAPVSQADVQLGVMGAQNNRQTKKARTDAQGLARFEGLPTGASQAYRVNLVYEGAKLSSTPFRLPDTAGYRVALFKRPVTRDDRMVFQMVGQAMVELRDDRLHVTQQSRLTNAGHEVYVFPKGGQLVELPEGFISFQSQQLMTDQRLSEKEGKGFVLEGSLPPGTVTLAWSFDLKLSGSEAAIPLDVPWRTYMFRVISDAPEGLSLTASGMPQPQRVADQGRSLWVTQVQKGPQDPPLKAVSLRLSGIPGPGPGRWIAVSLALLAILFGAWAVLTPGEGDAVRLKLAKQRKDELLEQVKALEEQKLRGDIGPEYHAERTEALENELAVVLRDLQLFEERGGAAKRGNKRVAQAT